MIKWTLLLNLGAHCDSIVSINHHSLDHQNASLIFNKKDIIDRNIRKTLDRPFRIRRLEQHLFHTSLDVIRSLAFDSIIDWELIKSWMNFNSFDRPTSRQLSKIISWRMKCSSLTLPTLDRLNRDYPLIMKDFKLCLLCGSENETNLHL